MALLEDEITGPLLFIEEIYSHRMKTVSNEYKNEQEVKVIWQKAPHGGPIPRLGVTPGGRKLYH